MIGLLFSMFSIIIEDIGITVILFIDLNIISVLEHVVWLKDPYLNTYLSLLLCLYGLIVFILLLNVLLNLEMIKML